MDAASGDAPLASFEAKWSDAHPEFRLALTFVPSPLRAPYGAFACIGYEIEHAAFGIREAQPAAMKLQWWAEELARLRDGAARHPLTRALAGLPGIAALAPAPWHEVVVGAFAQRDPEPAADARALFAAYDALYRPLAAVEARLFALDGAALARARALGRAVRETATLADALRDGRLPLPLDLLARHRLARGDLARESPAQTAALRDWLGVLHGEYVTLEAVGGGPGQAAAASADRWRVKTAAAADDPLAALQAAMTRLPLRASWAAWRAGRRFARRANP
ncbi:squalene/phytoene synthase family protein [Dokdonella sp.]|uniref:squalene/phytoene synthase family protein n=1 Tax=Dokdonella sp. TaxID=2291710 RepID=UPI002F3E48FA